jgi:pellino protein
LISYGFGTLEKFFYMTDLLLIFRCELVKYGELVILGYNGSLPQGDKGRRRSKFVLYRRSRPNGVSKSKHYVVKTPQTSQERRKAVSLHFVRSSICGTEYTQPT